MIAERINFEVSYKEFERSAVALVDGGHRSAAMAWLEELGQHIDLVIDTGDLQSVVKWSAQLDRLAENLPQSELTEVTLGYLTAALHRLDRRAAVLSQQRDVEERETEAA